MASYEKAMQGEKVQIGRAKSAPGTVGALIASYYQTADFLGLSPVTQRTYRNILERFRAEHADKRVAMLEKRHIQKLMGERAATPSAANRLLRMLHILMTHAIDLGWRKDDPTFGVKKLREKTGGFTTWGEEHIAAFLDYHKPGTRAHTALMLLLYTGQRRSDVVKMGPGNVKDGCIAIVQQKTGQPVDIPILPPLQVVLDTLPDTATFLTSDRHSADNGPLTPEGFTNWFRKMVQAVTHEENGKQVRSLPDGLSSHGLRKATCRRLAEHGCSPHEIMSISGHKTLAEVTRYTVAANRKKLAQQASRGMTGPEGRS
ncbi:MAG: tyrosine-type recombinase/integrase [Pseudomonadota bacterium]|nr:tyrosine-type recombinase/integrase [Pseudomonadota bacterium]